MALRKHYHQYALAGWIQQFNAFRSWHRDFQVPHTSCLHDKNWFPQGWAKEGDDVFCKYQRMHVCISWYSVSSMRRDKMLLSNVNMIESLFRFSETNEKVSKHYHSDKKKKVNALSLVASRLHCYNPSSRNSEHGLPTEKRDREVDWVEVTRHDQSRSFLRWENSRGEQERGGMEV